MKFCIWKKYVLASVYGILYVFDKQTSEMLYETQLDVGEVTEIYGIENAIYIVSQNILRQYILTQLNTYDYKLDMVMETDLQIEVNHCIFTRQQLFFFDNKQKILKIFNRNKTDQIYHLPDNLFIALKNNKLVFFNKNLIYAKDNIIMKYILDKQQEVEFLKLREPVVSMCTTAQHILIATASEGRIYDYNDIQTILSLQINPEKTFLQMVTPEYMCATIYCSRQRRVDVFRWFIKNPNDEQNIDKNNKKENAPQSKLKSDKNAKILVIKKPVVRIKLNNQGLFAISIVKAQPGVLQASIVQQHQLLPKVYIIEQSGAPDDLIQQPEPEMPVNLVSLDISRALKVEQTAGAEVGLGRRVWGTNLGIAASKINVIEQGLRTGDVQTLCQLVQEGEYKHFEELTETLRQQFVRFILMHCFNPQGIKWLIRFKNDSSVQEHADEIFMRLKMLQKSLGNVASYLQPEEQRTQVSDLEPLIIIDQW